MRKVSINLNTKEITKSDKPEVVNLETEDISIPSNSKQKDMELISTPKKKFQLSKKKKILILVIVLLIFLVGFIYYRISSYTIRNEQFDDNGNSINACTNILNPDCWTEAFKPQLIQTNGYTNVLVVGLDTRENGSLMNTDSLIIFSYNHNTHKTMMLSIPRDFYSNKYGIKISGVYASTKKKDPADSYRYLKEELSNITGLKIHYHVTVKFDTVTELVDSVGGIEICPYIEKDFVAKYPNPEATKPTDVQWIYYNFSKDCQKLDGEKALVYSRFRHIRSGPSILASDFSRARRQQEVINSLKDKLLAEKTTIQEKIENWWALLQTVNDNVTYTFTFEDFLAGISLLDVVDTKPAGVVLDTEFGGYNRYIVSSLSDETGYIISAKDKTYGAIKKEIEKIWANTDFYKEKPRIVVLNLTGAALPKDHITNTIKTETSFYDIYEFQTGAVNPDITGIKLFDLTAGTKPGSLAILKTKLGIENVELLPETYGITQSKSKEDFLIIVSP